MRWRHVGKARLWRACSADGYLHSICIHWYRRNVRTNTLKHSPGSRIAGVLYPGDVILLYEQPYDQIKGGLCSESDQDVISLSANPTSDGDMGGNSLAQRTIASALLIIGLSWERMTCMLCQ